MRGIGSILKSAAIKNPEQIRVNQFKIQRFLETLEKE